MIKLSVIVPIYNVEQYIERCAHSLFQQTYDNIEYIFVDDCSPDNSINILNEVLNDYPHRKSQVKIIRHSENKGLTLARNSGLDVAIGDYVAHCDSDDWVHPTMYETLLQMAIYCDADIVYCDFMAVYKEHSTGYKCIDCIDCKDAFIRSYMITGWTAIWNMVVRRNLYIDNNIKSPVNFTYCEDFYLSTKLLYFASRIEKVNLPLYYYNRMNLGSLLHTFSMKSINDELQCYSEMMTFFKEQGVLNNYIRELSWKILNCKKELVLNPEYHRYFLETFPESHNFIYSCPFLNVKMKIMMWLLSHKMGFILRPLLRIRKMILR